MSGHNSVLFYCSFGIAVAIATALLYSAYNMTYWKRRGAPYLKPSLLLGNMKGLIVDRLPIGRFMQDLYERGAGHRFVGIWTLQTPTILVRDPLVVKEFLVKEYSTFCDRFSGGEGTYDPMGRRNLFMINNPEWKYLRSKLSSAFTGGKLKNLFPLIQEVGSDFMDFIGEKAGKDGVVLEMKKLCEMYSVDVIVSCAFGIKSNAIRDENCEFRRAADIFTPTFKRVFDIAAYFMMPQLIDVLRIEMFGSFTNFFRRIFWESYEHREKTGIRRGDIIDSLLDIKNETRTTEFVIEGDTLASQAAIFFGAGFETTGTTLSFSLYHLALEPEIQDRARAEAFAVREKYGGFTYESLAELKYTEMIINEVTRLHPSMPMLNRVCRKDYKISNSDVVIENGTPVFFSVMGLHMDPEYFPDPEKFDPERFSEERKADIRPFTFIPFGDGPKSCIGRRFAMISLRLVLFRFLTTFRAERCPETQVPVKLTPGTLLITPERGLELRIVPLDART